jgi:hypothetical protein
MSQVFRQTDNQKIVAGKWELRNLNQPLNVGPDYLVAPVIWSMWSAQRCNAERTSSLRGSR